MNIEQCDNLRELIQAEVSITSIENIQGEYLLDCNKNREQFSVILQTNGEVNYINEVML